MPLLLLLSLLLSLLVLVLVLLQDLAFDVYLELQAHHVLECLQRQATVPVAELAVLRHSLKVLLDGWVGGWW